MHSASYTIRAQYIEQWGIAVIYGRVLYSQREIIVGYKPSPLSKNQGKIGFCRRYNRNGDVYNMVVREERGGGAV